MIAPYDRRKARQKDGKTLLVLPEIESGIFCLNVGLLINGKHTRGISIGLEESKSGSRKTIFNHSGMLSNRWKTMKFEIIQTNNFRIVFKVPQGQAWHSAIGLDDISVVSGQC